MTHDDLLVLLQRAIDGTVAIVVPLLLAWLIAQVSGLLEHTRQWLVVRKQNLLADMVSKGNASIQVALQNSANNLTQAAARGEFSFSHWPAVLERARQEMGRLREKMPNTMLIVQPTDAALIDGITAKLPVVAPVPEIVPVAVEAAEPPRAALVAEPAFPDRRTFFDAVRLSVFGGRMVQSQVDGCNKLLDYWNETTPTGDVRHLSYTCATVFWETAHTMQPVEEIGRGKGRFYGPTGFYGRGLVQLTLEDNYRRMSPIAGCDLVKAPERAMEWPIALRVLFIGMADGLFTGKKLSDFFGDNVDNSIGARAIINGSDRAEEIASIHQHFLTALSVSEPARLAA